MAQAADYLIIGSDLYGCSIAYHLALQGAKKVMLLERNEICQAATSKSCAIVRTHYSVEANLVHAVESLKVFESFDEQVGGEEHIVVTSSCGESIEVVSVISL